MLVFEEIFCWESRKRSQKRHDDVCHTWRENPFSFKNS